MIGKVMIGKSFGGCIAYCLEDKKVKREEGLAEEPMKHRATVLCYNQCYGDKKELTRQFQDVRRLHASVSKPVLHITLSMAPGEHLQEQDLLKMIEQCSNSMAFQNNQYIAVEHLDTNHQHIHIVANRIGFDGKVVSDSNNYKKVAQFCRKMEEELKLQRVLSPRKFLSQEQRQIPRSDSRKQQLQRDIQMSLLAVKSFAEFEAKVKMLGYKIEKARGIAFTDQKGVRIKGSEVGFSLSTIEKTIRQKTQENTSLQDVKLSLQRKENAGAGAQKEGENKSQDKEQNPAANLLYNLLKPERQNEAIPKEWLVKRNSNNRGHKL